jgi:hypothetical protein
MDSRPIPASVALSLGIYFAEHNTGHFKNNFVEFSSAPELIEIKGETFVDKLRYITSFNKIADTNLEAVFDLVLDAAVKNNVPQSELPSKLIIISDMEFNGAVYRRPDETLFTTIANKYAEHGYKLPRLVFWNVNSRTGTIPVKENELGVALVSGFSVNIVNMVMSNKLDPYECLLDVLNTERYQPIEDAVKDII